MTDLHFGEGIVQALCTISESTTLAPPIWG
jgi:hypothetical protein